MSNFAVSIRKAVIITNTQIMNKDCDIKAAAIIVSSSDLPL